MNNGELIRTLFPDGIYHTHSHGDEICIYLNDDGCLYFSLKWWNAEVEFNWLKEYAHNIMKMMENMEVKEND